MHIYNNILIKELDVEKIIGVWKGGIQSMQILDLLAIIYSYAAVVFVMKF